MQNLDNDFSNFKVLGIGKESQKQKDRRVKVKEKLKKEGGAFVVFNEITQKFNPAAMVPRSAALVGMRLNFFGLALRLYPALLDDAQLKAGHFDLENAKKAKDAWVKSQKVWKELGGDVKALRTEIIRGHDKPIFKTKKEKAFRAKEKNGFDGVDNTFSNYTGAEEAAAYASLGVALLGAIGKAVEAAGAKKNPYADKQIDTTAMDIPTQDEANNLTKQALDNPTTLIPETESMWKNPWVITGVSVGGVLAIWGVIKLVQHLKK